MKKRLLILSLAVALFFGVTIALNSNVYAVNSCAGVNTVLISCNDSDNGTVQVLKKIMDILLACVGIFGVVGITISGIQYLTAAGSEDKTRKAKRRIMEIVIGMAIYVCLYLLLDWLLPNFQDTVKDNGDINIVSMQILPILSLLA